MAISKKYNFASYEEIPANLSGYMLTVADADNIADVPLKDINEYLNQLEDWADEQDYYRSIGA